MRLYPPVTEAEARAWLTGQAAASFGADEAGDLEQDIATMAEAMAMISAVQLPDELEPLFP